MTTTIFICTAIYLVINSFISGIVMADNFSLRNPLKEIILHAVYAVLLILFAIPGALLTVVYALLYRLVLGPINSFFQIRFWFNFIFTNKWKNVSYSLLFELNQEANKKDVKTFKGRMFKYGVIYVNQLNNYEHKSTE